MEAEILQLAGSVKGVSEPHDLRTRRIGNHYAIEMHILMDGQIPHMDGYEATRRIRALEDRNKAGIPVIAVTANAFEEDRQVAKDAGMNGHLAKPYDIPMIMKTLDRLLN